MKIKLVPEWRRALRMFSVQLNILGGSAGAIYATMYDQLKETVSPKVVMWITIAVFVLSVLARLIDQDLKMMEEDDADH